MGLTVKERISRRAYYQFIEQERARGHSAEDVRQALLDHFGISRYFADDLLRAWFFKSR